MRSGAISDTVAGEKLVQILQEKGNQTNILVCSTKKYETSGRVWMHLVFGNQVTGKKNFVIL